ncbi:uncharacterized protein zgc:158258 isoform X1 [Hemibagrus wyckioides]|uniref:uncharacterized protein zgc:158258 isoform X1 n=1 Tax=Hemibagrus wyckioides TaxID=337641 RepID=UPI00266CF37A|nr:uncharacterized protein zgc:158258 isoform X1 [Hemibagrus wyckioides]XP_058229181.1 uncharacterized protein zgc:158258 isoform X1 [Hemibagrus wyckioides]
MKRQAHGNTDNKRSWDRIISFNSPAGANISGAECQSDSSTQHLSADEKACLSYLEEIIESTVTEDDDLSSEESQSFGNNHQRTAHGVHQDMSSCNSIPVTESSQDLSAEEKDCLKFLEETIDSLEDGGLSTDDAERFPESGYTMVKKHHINRMKNFMVPIPLVQATTNVSIPPKQKDQASSDWGSLSCDGSPGVMRPDKHKLEALRKLGLLKNVMPENKQGLDAPLSSSFPDRPQKHKQEASLKSSVSDNEQLAIQKLSHALSLSLQMVPDEDEDQQWALRRLGVLKD